MRGHQEQGGPRLYGVDAPHKKHGAALIVSRVASAALRAVDEEIVHLIVLGVH
jgi:hypothetical protein